MAAVRTGDSICSCSPRMERLLELELVAIKKEHTKIRKSPWKRIRKLQLKVQGSATAMDQTAQSLSHMTRCCVSGSGRWPEDMPFYSCA